MKSGFRWLWSETPSDHATNESWIKRLEILNGMGGGGYFCEGLIAWRGLGFLGWVLGFGLVGGGGEGATGDR